MEINFSNKQQQVLQALADRSISTVAFSGSMAGRSLLGIWWIIQECIANPDSRNVIARRSFKQLQMITAVQIEDLLIEMGIKADFYRQDMYFRFQNGSIIQLKSLDKIASDPDYLRLSASMYSNAFVDCAHEIEEAAINMLQRRLYWEKYKNMYGEKIFRNGKMLLSVIPTGNWIKKRFYDRRLRGTSDELILSGIFDHADEAFQERYLVDMKQSMGETERRRLIYGDWNYNR